MRRLLRFLPFLLILPAGAVPIWLHDDVDNAADTQVLEDTSLHALFERLRNSENTQAASRNEAEIYIRLSRSQSPTTNLLLENANVAYGSGDVAATRAILDEVVKLEPDFAEGLTRAAALAYQDGDLVRTRALLMQALAIEPRHFGAWSGLGLLREDLDDLKGAQQAYREALYWHPFFEGAKRGLLRVEAKLDGLGM